MQFLEKYKENSSRLRKKTGELPSNFKELFAPIPPFKYKPNASLIIVYNDEASEQQVLPYQR